MLLTTDAYYAAAFSTAKKYCKKMHHEKSGFSQNRRNGQYCHRWLCENKYNKQENITSSKTELETSAFQFDAYPTELIN